MSECPVCAGSQDPRELLLRSLCDKHLAEVVPPSDEEIRAAFAEGIRAWTMVSEGKVSPSFPGDLRLR